MSIALSGCCDHDKIPSNDKRLYSPKAQERNDAALALAQCGGGASASVWRLGQLLYDENVGVQSAAAYALRKIDTKQARTLLDQAIARRDKVKANQGSVVR